MKMIAVMMVMTIVLRSPLVSLLQVKNIGRCNKMI